MTQTKLIMLTEAQIQEMLLEQAKKTSLAIIDWLAEAHPQDTLTARNLIMNHGVMVMEAKNAVIH